MRELWCEEHDHFKRTCPWCELSEVESAMSTLIAWHNREVKRMQDELNQAIDVLEKISNLEYDAYQGHTHMLYDAQMLARQAIQSIKGGETDATKTSD